MTAIAEQSRETNQAEQQQTQQPKGSDKRTVWIGGVQIPRGQADTLYQKGLLSKGSISLRPPES